MNQKMDTIIALLKSSVTEEGIRNSLAAENKNSQGAHNYTIQAIDSITNKKVKLCKKCGHKNSFQEHNCVGCGTMFF